MESIKFAIFGDCVSQGIVRDRKHTRAMGFMNWVSVISNAVQNDTILKVADEIQITAYERRNLKLDLTKKSITYLLGEKADFLIIDPNDCRMQLAVCPQEDNQCESVYTISTSGRELYNKIKDNYLCNIKNPKDIPIQKYIDAAEVICSKIKEVYKTTEIIIHIHKFVDEYIDEDRILAYKNEKYPTRNKACQQIMNKMYEVLIQQLDGCHVIEFPDNVLGDSKHRFGLCGLHYHSLYDEYGKAAIQIICEKHPDEKLLLSSLRDKYSLKFQLLRIEIENKHRFRVMEARLDHLVNAVGYSIVQTKLKDIFQNITEAKVYFDAIELYKQDIGVLIAVRDTPGFVKETNNHLAINKFGFEKYPAKLWYTYCGFMLKGVVIVDMVSDVAELPTIWDGFSYNHSIHLESHSWRKLNQSKILSDGIEYSSNGRGANIVIIDAETFEVIDSVVYDTHEPQDYFRRIKEV